MQVKSKSKRIFEIPSTREGSKIYKGAESSLAAKPLSDKLLQCLRPVGRPKASVHKERISIRLSPEVTAYFRATGKGWQTRIDEALKEFIAAHQQNRTEP